MKAHEAISSPAAMRPDLASTCTLEAYAQYKGLPIDFLRQLGLSTIDNPYRPGRPALAIPYRNQDGSLHRLRIRTALLKAQDGGDQRMLWDRQAEGHGTILYGIDRLARAEGTLFLAEGESDPHTLWHHGFSALGIPGASNFQPERDDPHLAGRDVVTFMEMDQGGRALIKRLSRSEHRDRIRVAVMVGLKDPSDSHMTCPERFRARVESLAARAAPINALLSDIPELDARAKVVRPGLPDGFRYRTDGEIEFEDGTDGDGNPAWTWLCSRLEILATSRDHNQRSWGLLLRVRTPDGHWHRRAVPREMLAGSGEELQRLLLDLGLHFFVGTKAKLAIFRLLNAAEPAARALTVRTTGWHGTTFVLPDRAFGEPANEVVIFEPSSPVQHAFATAGTLRDWQDGLARYAIGNSRLVCAISAGFAGPMLQLLGIEGGGLHFRGPSSSGKTTLLHAAGSVWGGGGLAGYIKRWRATDNGLESVASLHCDTLLTLDELAEIEPSAAAKAGYLLANGQGKVRAQKTGDARPALEWRLLFLSSGEISLNDKIGEDRGRRSSAGHEVRIVDLEADAGRGFGVFDELHGFNRPSDLADAITRCSAQNYGHASRAFLHGVTQDLEMARGDAAARVADWLRQHCPDAADGQARRVARRFALIAAAGEAAIAMHILPWAKGEAEMGAARLFEDWLVARGGLEPAEVSRGIAAVRSYIERHGTDRFLEWSARDIVARDRAGYRKQENDRTTYFFFTDAFREACGGQDPGLVARVLAERGMLLKGSDGRSNRVVRLSNMESHRMYLVTSAIFDSHGQ